MNKDEIKKAVLNYIAFDNQIDIFKLPPKEYRQYFEFIVDRSINNTPIKSKFDINNCDIFRKKTNHRSVIIITLVEPENNFRPEYAAFVLDNKERYLYTASSFLNDEVQSDSNQKRPSFYSVSRYDSENNNDITTKIQIVTQKDFLDLIYSHLNEKLN